MSLLSAMPPAQMRNRELAREAAKLRGRRFLTPAEELRLVDLSAEMDRRGLGASS